MESHLVEFERERCSLCTTTRLNEYMSRHFSSSIQSMVSIHVFYLSVLKSRRVSRKTGRQEGRYVQLFFGWHKICLIFLSQNVLYKPRTSGKNPKSATQPFKKVTLLFGLALLNCYCLHARSLSCQIFFCSTDPARCT